MRTDILRWVHRSIETRMPERDKKSPLVILIASIEEVLATYDVQDPVLPIEPNPFNQDPLYRFDPESDYPHDIKLLKSQLKGLREILASIGRW